MRQPIIFLICEATLTSALMTGSGPQAEVLTGPERRRRWAIDGNGNRREFEHSGSSGAVVARRWDLDGSAVHLAATGSWVAGAFPVIGAGVRAWWSRPRLAAIAAPDAGSEVFAPVVVPARGEGTNMSVGGVMEIELSGGQRRVDRHVDAKRCGRCWR